MRSLSKRRQVTSNASRACRQFIEAQVTNRYFGQETDSNIV
jgi:hypothetical protein